MGGRMTNLAPALDSLGFTTTWYVKERTSIVELVPKKGRCGIYVLWFENGEFYVGKTEDVTRRYMDHRRNHNDIVRVSFQKTGKRELDVAEDAVIGELERQKIPLRNISGTSSPPVDSDFELIMTRSEQEEWRDDPSFLRNDGDRTNDPELRRKYEVRFTKLMRQPFVDEAIDVLRKYVAKCIPCPVRSEMSFWGVSCLPAGRGQGVKVYRADQHQLAGGVCGLPL